MVFFYKDYKLQPSQHILVQRHQSTHQNNVWNLFNFNNQDTREQCQYAILVSLLLNVNKFHLLFWCFHCRLWRRKCKFERLLKLLKEYLSVFLDHRYGILSFLPNMFSGYGWNPGNRFREWFGDILEQVTNNRDITFQQVWHFNSWILTLLWRWPLSYKNQFLYDNGLRHERVKLISF